MSTPFINDKLQHIRDYYGVSSTLLANRVEITRLRTIFNEVSPTLLKVEAEDPRADRCQHFNSLNISETIQLLFDIHEARIELKLLESGDNLNYETHAIACLTILEISIANMLQQELKERPLTIIPANLATFIDNLAAPDQLCLVETSTSKVDLDDDTHLIRSSNSLLRFLKTNDNSSSDEDYYINISPELHNKIFMIATTIKQLCKKFDAATAPSENPSPLSADQSPDVERKMVRPRSASR